METHALVFTTPRWSGKIDTFLIFYPRLKCTARLRFPQNRINIDPISLYPEKKVFLCVPENVKCAWTKTPHNSIHSRSAIMRVSEN